LAKNEYAQLPPEVTTQDTKAAALTYRMFDSEEKAAQWLKESGQ
jgi:hypothetical protein